VEVFPYGNTLLGRGFELNPNFEVPKFRNCLDPKKAASIYIDPNVDITSPIEKRRAELNKWCLLKAGTDLQKLDYTTEPLRIERHGGRGPDGKQWIKHRGGGAPRSFFWLDRWRWHPGDDDFVEERVLDTIDDQVRTGLLALVAGGLRKRYVSATEGMKLGDIIITSKRIPPLNHKFNSGDCYQLAAFQPGSKLSFIERDPGDGARLCMAAGSFATLVRKYFDDKKKSAFAIIEMPSKKSFILDQKCMAVYGQSAKVLFNQTKYSNFPQKKLETDKRSRSGLWHRKDGRFGRKIKPKKPPFFLPEKKHWGEMIDIQTGL